MTSFSVAYSPAATLVLTMSAISLGGSVVILFAQVAGADHED
jgi:hypothetical protein